MKHYLYRHTRLDKNEPFYIGIGTKRRNNYSITAEYERAYMTYNRNNIWKSITFKTGYEIDILFEHDDYEFIKQKEVEFIKLYGRIDLKTGILANLTDGGDGTLGVIKSEEGLKSISEASKKRVGELNPFYGKTHSEEWRRNHSNFLIGKYAGERSPHYRKPKSEEHKEKLRQAKLGEKHPTARKVIDLNTLEIYNSIKAVADSISMKENTLYCKLIGRSKNNTAFIFLENYKGEIVQ